MRLRPSIQFLFAIVFLSLFHFGCKKHTTVYPATFRGTWELRETSAAMNPNDMTYPAGNGNTLSFTDTKYTLSKTGQAPKHGEYTVVPDNTASTSVCLSFTNGTFTNRIIYDGNDSATKIFYQIDADGQRLTFFSGCYALDAGHSETYWRIAVPGN